MKLWDVTMQMATNLSLEPSFLLVSTKWNVNSGQLFYMDLRFSLILVSLQSKISTLIKTSSKTQTWPKSAFGADQKGNAFGDPIVQMTAVILSSIFKWYCSLLRPVQSGISF